MVHNRTWLAFANENICNHRKALKELGFVNWTTNVKSKFAENDIVYLFMNDDRSVRFKLKVDKVDVPREDGNYWIDSAPNDNTYKLTLVAEYNGNLLKEEVLKRMGFKGGGSILNPSCNNTELLEYINDVFKVASQTVIFTFFRLLSCAFSCFSFCLAVGFCCPCFRGSLVCLVASSVFPPELTATRPRQELQATLHCADLKIGTAFRPVLELQVFHLDGFPSFKSGFLFRAYFHATNGIGAFPLVCPHVLQFMGVSVPADEHGDLLPVFRVFDLDNTAQIASSQQVALFLLGKFVPVIRALKQLFIHLHAVQLRHYRPVLCLIERELDIGRFKVETAYRPRNGIGVAGFVATHHPVEILCVFQSVGGNADFLQVLPVDFSRVETVVLPAPVIVGIRNSQHFHPSVALRCGGCPR